MTQGAKPDKGSRADKRQARLAAQLRSNLKKRKDQARGRAEAENPAEEHQGRDEQSRS